MAVESATLSRLVGSARDGAWHAVGLEGFKEMVSAFRMAFPDERMVMEDVIAEGNKVITWAYIVGTHEGPLEGIPATGKRVKVKDVDLFRIENGKVVESAEATGCHRRARRGGGRVGLRLGIYRKATNRPGLSTRCGSN